MKHVVLRSASYGNNDPLGFKFFPAHLFVQQKVINVGAAKPSEIQVGSNVDEALDQITNKVLSIKDAFKKTEYNYKITFKTSYFELTSNKSRFQFTFEGTLKHLAINTAQDQMSLTKVDGSGAALTGSNGTYLDFEYKCFVNDSTVDASFDQTRYIVFDKYTRTIKAVNTSKQTTSDDEAQVEIRVVVKGPQLSQLSSQIYDNKYIHITDSDLGNNRLLCYKDDNVDAFTYLYTNQTSTAMIGLIFEGASTAGFTNDGNEPYAEIYVRDLSVAAKPLIYSRI